MLDYISVKEAAEECHISQSAISQQVQSLERELGFDLLERKKRRFTLIPAGEYFYKKVWCWLLIMKECAGKQAGLQKMIRPIW